MYYITWEMDRHRFHVDYQMGDELFIPSFRAHYTLFVAIYAKLLWDNHDFPSSGRIVKVFLGRRSGVRHAGTGHIGMTIGYSERFLIILFGQYAAMGLVIDAKSILQFPISGSGGEVHKEREYVLVGTMVSPSSAY